MVELEPVKKMSKKDLLRLDEELSFKLQAKEEEEKEEERLAREKSSTKARKVFANIQELFDKAMKRVNTFVDYRTELVQESSKKAEAEIAHESIPADGDDVTIDATPLSTNSPTIVDYKIYKEGKKSYFQIIIADARFKKTEPVNYMDNFLLLNLTTMFKHHVEDNVWKNQQGLVKVLNSKLYDFCGVHCVIMQSMLFYLLVEKMYPLINCTLHQMFNDVMLQVDYKCKMAFELLRLVKKQLKEGYERIVGIKSLPEVTAAKEDKGDMNDGCDITVKDVERLRKILTPSIHTLPNLKLKVQPYMPLGLVCNKAKVVREEEHDYDIPLQDHIMQPFTPQTFHIIPPNEDYDDTGFSER
ncbi:hypothetical protein Tco_0487935 [Tanacetum coccineum]